MSQGRAIDPLPLEQFPSEADSSDPGFEQLFADLVADSATPADGFDDDVAAASGILDSLDGALGDLGGQTGGTLDDAFAEVDALDPGPAAQNLTDFEAALPDATAPVDNLGIILAGAVLPTPPQPAPTTAPGCASIDMGGGPIVGPVGTVFRVWTVTLTNKLSIPLTILSHKWDPDLGFTFQAIFGPPGPPFPALEGQVIPPFAAVQISIYFGTGSPGTFTSTLRLQTDGPDPQPCLTVTATGFASRGGGLPPGSGGGCFVGDHISWNC